jgi:hypothetical protein
VHVALAKQHAAALAEHGWSADDTTALAVDVGTLDSSMAAQAEAKIEAGGAVKEEEDAIDGAKQFLRRLRYGLPRAIREAKKPGVTLAAFAAGERLGRATPKIAAYLMKIKPAVAALDGALAGSFGGKKASEELDVVKGALDGADTAQEIARTNVPEQTLAVYEVKGRVLEGIEDLNRAAKSAFDGQAEVAAKFNKDILLRARKARAKKAEAPAAGTTPKAPVGGATPQTPAAGDPKEEAAAGALKEAPKEEAAVKAPKEAAVGASKEEAAAGAPKKAPAAAAPKEAAAAGAPAKVSTTEARPVA